jgi:hypothetical protein
MKPPNEPEPPAADPRTETPPEAAPAEPEALDRTDHDVRREEEQRAAKRHRDARRVGRRLLQAVSDNRRALATAALTVAGVLLVGGIASATSARWGPLVLRRASPLVARALPLAIRTTAGTLGVSPAVAAPFVVVARVFARLSR